VGFLIFNLLDDGGRPTFGAGFLSNNTTVGPVLAFFARAGRDAAGVFRSNHAGVKAGSTVRSGRHPPLLEKREKWRPQTDSVDVQEKPRYTPT